MIKLITCILMCTVVSGFASALDVTPKKVGPVSYYGALHTSGSKIIGEKNNLQAMLRGVSLFWSDATGLPYYNPTVISWAVDNLKIDVFRYAMGIEYTDSDGGTKNKIDEQFSYKSAPEGQLATIDKMVQAAIENDVYIIIDWHSHRAHLETNIAKSFFEYISQKYKDVPNIIYEIYNEPVSRNGGDWSTIKDYANTICEVIRANTQNLIIVGTPNWSQHPEQGAKDPVQSTNIAYVFHFYAATHSKGSYSGYVSGALSAGYPVFISEWGTTNADADGEPNSSATSEWTSFMDQNMIPNCNWSLRQQTSDVDKESEKSAIFAGEKSLVTVAALNAATYTSSGNIIKSYLTKNARSWADSLVKGKNIGSCAFKQTVAEQTDGRISGVLKSGCTYTSSNEKVAYASESDIVIGDYGFVIFTGDDGSESVVTVKQVAGQTITNLENLTCYYTGSCTTDTKTSRTYDYETTDGTGDKDYLLTMEDKTEQGAMVTSFTALDPTIVSISKSTCKNRLCPNSQKDQQVWMLHFRNYGTGRIVASAKAVAGYRAMQDTFEISYKKGIDKMTGKFKNLRLALGESVTSGFPDTTLNGNSPVTYTFNGELTSPYLTREGQGVVAGNQDAIVAVTAKVPESDNYEALDQMITVIIGDSASAVNLKEYNDYINRPISFGDESSSSSIAFSSSSTETASSSSAEEPDALVQKSGENFHAKVFGSTLQFTTVHAGPVKMEVYDALGVCMMRHNEVYSAGNHVVPLNNFARGSYILVIRQEGRVSSIRWINK